MVPLDSAGLHLLPDSLATGLGSLFAGWLVYRTGKYKTINLVLGILPLCGVIPLIFCARTRGSCKSGSVSCRSVWKLFQTALIVLQSHSSESQMCLERRLDSCLEGLDKCLALPLPLSCPNPASTPSCASVSTLPTLKRSSRHSLSLVTSLPAPLQRLARDAYAASLQTVFIVAACLALAAFIVRSPILEKAMEEYDVDVDECASR
ncbi:hypothetical protein OG21DRAFT_1516842 [Imleria badia]|nr:hypothetical protein OG21DRAFT_1516842 [Imleria badia]